MLILIHNHKTHQVLLGRLYFHTFRGFGLGWPSSGMSTDSFGLLKFYRVFTGFIIYWLLWLLGGI